MLKINDLIKELNKRKSEWTALAIKADISRKTIERIASNKTDPRTSIVEKLSTLLKTKTR